MTNPVSPKPPDWTNHTSVQDITLDNDSEAQLDLGKGTLTLTKPDGKLITYNITIGNVHVKGEHLANTENQKKVTDLFNLIIKDSGSQIKSRSGDSFTKHLSEGTISKLELSTDGKSVTEHMTPSIATAGKVNEFSKKVFSREDTSCKEFQFEDSLSTRQAAPVSRKKTSPPKPKPIPTEENVKKFTDKYFSGAKDKDFIEEFVEKFQIDVDGEDSFSDNDIDAFKLLENKLSTDQTKRSHKEVTQNLHSSMKAFNSAKNGIDTENNKLLINDSLSNAFSKGLPSSKLTDKLSSIHINDIVNDFMASKDPIPTGLDLISHIEENLFQSPRLPRLSSLPPTIQLPKISYLHQHKTLQTIIGKLDNNTNSYSISVLTKHLAYNKALQNYYSNPTSDSSFKAMIDAKKEYYTHLTTEDKEKSKGKKLNLVGDFMSSREATDKTGLEFITAFKNKYLGIVNDSESILLEISLPIEDLKEMALELKKNTSSTTEESRTLKLIDQMIVVKNEENNERFYLSSTSTPATATSPLQDAKQKLYDLLTPDEKQEVKEGEFDPKYTPPAPSWMPTSQDDLV
jgi:hypothetical protein